MNDDNHDNQAKAVKLSDKFVDFIDLTDENLEEVAIMEFGIQGGQCGGGCGCGGACGGGYGSYGGYGFGGCRCGGCRCGGCG